MIRRLSRRQLALVACLTAALALTIAVLHHYLPCGGGRSGGDCVSRTYPWHTSIVATTFWVGEIFDPNASDGSQVFSTYDDNWYANYGGCDGAIVNGVCQTERRTSANGWFPTNMQPRQNPFYLDLPYDDLNDFLGLANRTQVIPWAHDARYADVLGNPKVSLMKNRWVELRRDGHTCFGQIEDAGPGEYHDSNYVFGSHDQRPANQKFNHAGMDVSPALNGCLGFSELNGENDQLDWRFVDDADIAQGPWTKVVTH